MGRRLKLVCLLLLASATAVPAHGARALFIGDVMAHQQQLDAAKLPGGGWDFAPQFRRVRPLLTDAFLIANLETVFAGARRGYAGYPLFNTPDSLVDALKDLEVDLLTLANNHILDRGTGGARRTTEILDAAGIPWIGLGLDETPANDAVLIESEGLRWAFVNYAYGSNLPPKDEDVHLNVISAPAIAEGMERARALNPDVIVACFHWGEEYHYSPNTYQKAAAELALAEGAHLVIGTHPHVLQPVEMRFDGGGAPRAIVWSLGNFVSFQRTLPRERTCILSAEFQKEGGRTRLVRLAAAPLQVILTPSGHKKPRRVEVTYAGWGGNFNHSGISKAQLQKIRRAGSAVLQFLGAQDEVDEYGFYTLWSESSSDILPRPRRKSPLD